MKLAVVGATGAVGEVVLQVLHQRRFPVTKLYPLASKRSLGRTLSFGRQSLAVINLEEFDFTQCQLAFFTAGSSVSEQYVAKAVQAGCLVIDNTSFFRYRDEVPLIVSEVNPHRVQADCGKIIANPNCSTMQLLVTIKPLVDAVGVQRVSVATYQAVSGLGKQAINTLSKQTLQMIKMQSIMPQDYMPFQRQMAFNVIPQIDRFEDNGYTREEMKMVWETHKILEDPTIGVNVTCVRVPVFYGHSLAIQLELGSELSAAEAKRILTGAKGIHVMAKDGDYPTPIGEGSGKDAVYVGRIPQGSIPSERIESLGRDG